MKDILETNTASEPTEPTSTAQPPKPASKKKEKKEPTKEDPEKNPIKTEIDKNTVPREALKYRNKTEKYSVIKNNIFLNFYIKVCRGKNVLEQLSKPRFFTEFENTALLICAAE